MNRELKFRAWDTENNRMSDPFNLGSWARFSTDKEIEGMALKEDIRTDNIGKDEFRFDVMQSTGQKDMHGTSIYEADILSGHNDGLVQVVWRGTGWECDFADDGNIGLDELCIWFKTPVEIIGNIYANPELLEPKP